MQEQPEMELNFHYTQMLWSQEGRRRTSYEEEEEIAFQKLAKLHNLKKTEVVRSELMAVAYHHNIQPQSIVPQTARGSSETTNLEQRKLIRVPSSTNQPLPPAATASVPLTTSSSEISPKKMLDMSRSSSSAILEHHKDAHDKEMVHEQKPKKTFNRFHSLKLMAEGSPQQRQGKQVFESERQLPNCDGAMATIKLHERLKRLGLQK